MTKTIQKLAIILTFLFSTACMVPFLQKTSTPEAQPPEEAPIQAPVETAVPMPYIGIWVSDIEDITMTKQVLVLTETSIYHVRTGNWANVKSEAGKEGGVHEDFYEIVSSDVDNSTMVVKLKWVRTDGRFGGFDMPTKTFKYQIDGDTIRFSFGAEGEYPAEVKSDLYIRQ